MHSSRPMTCTAAILLTALICVPTGCGAQKTDSGQPAGAADRPATAASNGEGRRGGTAKPQAPAVPATVKQATAAIDLEKQPLLDGADVSIHNSTQLYYTAPSSMADAIEFHTRALGNDGWTQDKTTTPTDNYTSVDFVKDGFRVTLNVHAPGDPPGVTAVSLNHHGNVDSRTLPIPPGTTTLYADFATSIYLTSDPVADVAENVMEQLAAAGWKPYTLAFSSTSQDPTQVTPFFKNNGIGLIASVQVAAAQEGKTAIQYALNVLSYDVPTPADAQDIEFHYGRQYLACRSATDIAGLADFYRDAADSLGWPEDADRGGVGDGRATLFFKLDDQNLLAVDLTDAGDGTTAVTVERLSAIDVAEHTVDPPAEAVPERTFAAEGIESPEQFGDEEMGTADSAPDNPAIVRTIDTSGNSIKALAYAPDDRAIAAGGFWLNVYDTADGEELLSPHVTDEVRSLAYSPDGKMLAIADSAGTISVWSVSDEEMLGTIEPETEGVGAVEFSPDGNALAAAGDNGQLTLWNVDDGERIATIDAHEGMFDTLDYSPDGKLLVTARFNIKLWDASSGELVRTLDREEGPPCGSICFSPDGKQLASAEMDCTVRLWDVASGKLEKTLREHKDPVVTVAYSPDGKYLTSGCWGYKVVLWDLETGEAARVLRGHNETVAAVAFSSDGSQLATAAEDGLIRVWDVATAIENEAAAVSTNEAAEELDLADIEVEDADGLPIPSNNTGMASEGTQFSRRIETGVNASLATMIEFYRGEMVARGFSESEDASVVEDESARLVFTNDDGQAVVEIEHTLDGTEIRITLKRPEAAKQAGILPDAGKARIIMGNDTESAATVTIADQKFELKAGEGTEKPDGPTVNLAPGTYTCVVQIGDGEPTEEELELGADETWGLMLMSDVVFPLKIY